MFIYSNVAELISSKFFKKCHLKILDGWELHGVELSRQSGFTLHKAKFQKYINSIWAD